MAVHNFLSCRKKLLSLTSKHIKSLTNNEILVICSLAYNFTTGLVSLCKRTRILLQKYRRFLEQLAAPDATKTEKRRLLARNLNKSVKVVKLLANILNNKYKSGQVK